MSEPTMEGLTYYRVTLHEEKGDKHTIYFDCWAEDDDHATNQAENAYPAAEVIHATTFPSDWAVA